MSKPRFIPPTLLEPKAPKLWAVALALPYQTVVAWRRRGVPAARVLDVERTLGVARHDVRPDLYPQAGVAA
jgi:DNA-binding transcriptional regulator YdaS (Cro superfamily)